jgi:hypothetical protein
MRLLFATAAITAGFVAAGDDKPAFTVKTKRDDDRVTAKVEKGVTVIDVRSPFGIGGATVERTGEVWPEAVTLRLHLSGLESFRATCGKATLHGAVQGFRNPQPIKLTVEGKKDPPQGPDDPNSLRFRAVGKDGKSTEELPLKDGYFEMRLPKAFFDGNPTSFKLEWVDWVRR